MWRYLLLEDGFYYNSTFLPDPKNVWWDVLWSGKFSAAKYDGPIVKFIQNYLRGKKSIIVFFQTDGYIYREHIDTVLKDNGLETEQKNIIVPTLGQNYWENDLPYLFMPLDDDFFVNGVTHYFPVENLPKWEERSSTLFWRGCASGGGMESDRCRTVAKMLEFEDSDVRLTKGWHEGKNIPETFFGKSVEPGEFLKYKIFLIIDGNVISSNHMWGFATGCVPFIISKSNCWFLRFLIPYYHYIPVMYDLSDLQQKVVWVRENDAAAQKIAENALQFSREVFSSDFQKRYLMDEIDRLLR